MENLPHTGPPNLKIFTHSNYTHKIFRIGKNIEKISTTKLGGTIIRESSFNEI